MLYIIYISYIYIIVLLYHYTCILYKQEEIIV